MNVPTDTPTPAAGRALRTLGAAVVLGIAGDLLLRGGMWRAGATIWLAILVLATLALGVADRERRWMLAGVLAGGVGLALRDAPYLWPVDFLSVLCMGALIVWHGSGKRLADLTIVQAVRAVPLALLTAASGASAAIKEGVSEGGGSEETSRRARMIGIGAILALPPLFVVALLLGESDVVFGGFVSDLFDFLSRSAVQHAVVIALLAWAAAGWVRAAIGEGTLVRLPDPASPGAPFLMLSVGVYGMVVLLALYLGTQARVLFGGEAYLQAAAGLTRAEYAREGFFSLVAASGIVLGALAIADWLMATDDEGGRRRFRAAGMMLVAEVVVILASAVVRMAMYVGEFGLTVDRAFASAVMVWVLATLVVFSVTTLRGRSARFAPMTLVVTIAWVTLLNVVNLESVVVRVNTSRAVAGASFDWNYHSRLSGDALPALRARASTLSAEDCARLETALRETWRAAGPRRADESDWRSTNLPMSRARAWLAEGGTLGCAAASR